MIAGYFGKLPARGDFLRVGLPRSFVDPWDEWWQVRIAASRAAALDWEEAWLEAPMWRFVLGSGACGPDGAVGVWMPSVDRAGRFFPLTIAAVGDDGPPGLADEWLGAAQDAGLDALEDKIDPDALAIRLAEIGNAPLPPVGAGASRWWTEGSPRVPATTLTAEGLPGGTAFAAMLDASWIAPENVP